MEFDYNPKYRCLTNALIVIFAAMIFTLQFGERAVADTLEDAKAAFKKSHYATALRLYLPLAEQGNVEAQTDLAFLYYLAAWRMEMILLWRAGKPSKTTGRSSG